MSQWVTKREKKNRVTPVVIFRFWEKEEQKKKEIERA
jgi:hypothetical protein